MESEEVVNMVEEETLEEIYGDMKKYYDSLELKKDKTYCRELLIKEQMKLRMHHIKCGCGKEFHSDMNAIEEYIDLHVIKIKKKFTIPFPQFAINKWYEHRHILEAEIDTKHTWNEMRVK